MLMQRLDLLSDEQPVAMGARADKTHPVIGKFQHLKSAGVMNKLLDMFGNQLFRTDSKITGTAACCQIASARMNSLARIRAILVGV